MIVTQTADVLGRDRLWLPVRERTTTAGSAAGLVERILTLYPVADSSGWTEELKDIDEQLQAMEERTSMTSEEFNQSWLQGTIPDTFENNAWALLIQARNTLLARTRSPFVWHAMIR